MSEIPGPVARLWNAYWEANKAIRLLNPGLELRVERQPGEPDVFCLALYRNERFVGWLGPCLRGRSNLFRIRDRLQAIKDLAQLLGGEKHGQQDTRRETPT